MAQGSLSLAGPWLVLELGQQQCTEEANQMQIQLFMQEHRLEKLFDKKCWVLRAKGELRNCRIVECLMF